MPVITHPILWLILNKFVTVDASRRLSFIVYIFLEIEEQINQTKKNWDEFLLGLSFEW